MKPLRKILLSVLAVFLTAGLVQAAATWTITERSIFGNKRVAWGTMQGDSSYVTGGYQVTPANLGLSNIGMFIVDGAQYSSNAATAFVAAYSRPTGYIQVFQAYGAAVTAGFTPTGTVSAPSVTTAQISVQAIGVLSTAPVYIAGASPGFYSTAAESITTNGLYVTASAPSFTGTGVSVTLNGGAFGEVPTGTNLATFKLGWFAIGY